MSGIVWLVWIVTAVSAWAGKGKPEPLPTVAVFSFDYDGADAELAALRTGLASMLISDLTAQQGFEVVERERLQQLIAEQELGKSGKLDTDRAAKIGKIVGAQRMVVGRYFEFGGRFRIDARMFDVETSVQLCGVGVTGHRDAFFDIEADIADKLAIAMLSDGKNCKQPRPGAPEVVPAKTGRTLEKLPISTAATYSRALDAKDEGNDDKAKELLNKVVEDEPEFTLAKEELAKLLK
ncbi:MAG: CsgG/HfaB family protein [Myxococcota bacterium]